MLNKHLRLLIALGCIGLYHSCGGVRRPQGLRISQSPKEGVTCETVSHNKWPVTYLNLVIYDNFTESSERVNLKMRLDRLIKRVRPSVTFRIRGTAPAPAWTVYIWP